MGDRQPLNAIGGPLQKARLELGLTQQSLAAKCNLIGLDIGRETISQIERGVRGVSDLEMILLSKALKIEITRLVPKTLPPWKKDLRPPNAVE
ncbi:helix-turn-helix transcriptional regulator [Luteolibacter ambystomatis]|uniref:Helix-turn-helix transcriptional regulator n=1 Tax=Luteolibacter ambystomatis TaxID=2824561 RepID=A0A975IXJ8_9BACT|nr:helix-turn-helix transcriptional regulator [Luteolibacter ambystomatis]